MYNCTMQGFLHGVLMCDNCTLGNLRIEAVAWSNDIRKSIALCNDLVPLNTRKVTGHADERKAFADIEAAFLVSLAAHCSHVPLHVL